MPMDVHEKVDVAALQRLSHHFFHTDDLGGRLLEWILPLSIQIEPC